MTGITKPQIVAAFDFDGTVTHYDTLLPFLFYVSSPIKIAANIPKLAHSLISYQLGLIENGHAKEKVLTQFFGGLPISQLKVLAKNFATEWLPSRIRPDSMERIHWHQKQGHQCILVSASLALYLEPWALSVGFDHVIASTLETASDGRITGKLTGGNCSGTEKINRLNAWLGQRENYVLYAYGNSKGDKELLDAADFSYYREMPTNT